MYPSIYCHGRTAVGFNSLPSAMQTVTRGSQMDIESNMLHSCTPVTHTHRLCQNFVLAALPGHRRPRGRFLVCCRSVLLMSDAQVWTESSTLTPCRTTASHCGSGLRISQCWIESLMWRVRTLRGRVVICWRKKSSSMACSSTVVLCPLSDLVA